jgi:hypothetical protein
MPDTPQNPQLHAADQQPASVELIHQPKPRRTRTPYGALPNTKQRNPKVVSFKLGRWPPGSNMIKRDGDDLRFILENALCQRTDEGVDVQQAALIQSACRHEIAARLAQQWMNSALRKEQLAERQIDADVKSGLITPAMGRELMAGISGMTPMEKLAYLKEIGNHTDQRDKCLQKLGLDVKHVENEWSTLNRRGPQNSMMPRAIG